ncbi:MAG: hypothetical protein EOP37_09570 [Rubrivivax sp.]|nr:MAG: hypothetical protein EOP37_09570 [Rubrivivax sp.]
MRFDVYLLIRMLGLAFAVVGTAHGAETEAVQASTPECSGLSTYREIVRIPERIFKDCVRKESDSLLKGALSDIAYGDEPEDVIASKRAGEIFNELERREVTVGSDWRAYLRITYIGWSFPELNKLRQSEFAKHWFEGKKLPRGVVPLPMSSSVVSGWDVDMTGNMLREREISTVDRPLVVVFSPTCNPCRRAALDIDKDPELRQIFFSCSLWVSPLDQTFSMDDYGEWDKKHPRLRGAIVKDWNRLALPFPVVTPTFHVFEHGRSVLHIDGWPREGRKDQIVAFARENQAMRKCMSKV